MDKSGWHSLWQYLRQRPARFEERTDQYMLQIAAYADLFFYKHFPMMSRFAQNMDADTGLYL